MKFLLSTESFSQLPGLPIFEKAFSDRINANSVPVIFESGRERLGFSLTREERGFRVHYNRACDAYRAIGLLLADRPPENVSQDCAHETVGVMWDLSRNGVLRPEAWEELFRKFALLGINSVQLYMEDTYEIPGEPFFGYGRGAYSQEELRHLDAYGRQLGIEVIPCVQTLGHLSQIHQWPIYADTVDVNGVLLVDGDSTRRLIGRMLDSLAECFQTRKIHIGMDEAFGVGSGNYLTKNGYERPFDLLNRHLQMVVKMCRERGLLPMIWSDMYFRIASARRDYYDKESVIPPEVASRIPPEVDLVYWDYYHADVAFYEEWIQRHRAMGKEPIFAAGAWNWGRFWTYAPRWRESMAAGMKAARKQKLAHTWLTLWSDDGAEFHPASTFPAIQYFAEWAYYGDPDDHILESKFAAIFQGSSSLPAYLRASDLDEIPIVRESKESTVNYSKWILWQDAVLGFLDAHLTPDLPGHYRKLADELDAMGADEPVSFAAKVARAVAPKAELHLKARAAWRAGDTDEIRRLKNEVLPECQNAVLELWTAHRAVWRQWNKPFGWEVIEHRYAGCVARLESLGNLLEACLSDNPLGVPEWELDPLPIHESPSEAYFNYDQAATPSSLK